MGKRRSITRQALLAGLVAIGFSAGYLSRDLGSIVGPGETERQSNTVSHLTSPFLECLGVINSDRALVRIRVALERFIRDAKLEDSSLQVSVYARDLNNGPWIGIEERLPAYVPASMWKLPLMMYILAQADGDPTLLDRELTFPGAERMRRQDSMDGAPDQRRLQTGQAYSYDDLLFRMIAYSDNYAEELLLTGLTKADVDRMLQAIGVHDTAVDGVPFVSAKSYSALFRVLYNSTWLSRPISEYGLGLLTQSYLRNGLRKYIPSGIEVASKFGLYQVTGPSAETQFHECGIVYHPESPYSLCIMTKSRTASPDRLADIVAEISRLTWTGKSRRP